MLQLPLYELKTKKEEGQSLVWDPIRRKWLVHTPEEHVRQCLTIWLQEEIGLPRGLMSAEKGLMYDRRRKRYDLTVYDTEGQVRLVCECKAPQVPIDEKALMQLAQYNRELRAPLLLLTNGPTLLIFSRDEEGKWSPVESETAFRMLLGV